jgi:predicted metallopeptidase
MAASYIIHGKTRPERGDPADPPLLRGWGGPDNLLPVRVIRAAARQAVEVDGVWRWPTGPEGQPFDFCGQVRRLCVDIVGRCAELRHLDLTRTLIAVTQARNSHPHGLQARVTPLRFHGGRLTRQRRGVTYQVQRYLVNGRDILYLVTFCLPRFLDLEFDEKFITLFHELYHISPAFDGDLRRHQGRYSVHSHSQRRYDEYMAQLARAYLSSGADPALYAFLRYNFAQLQRRHGSVVGVVVPRPKIVPVPLISAQASRQRASRSPADQQA